MFPVNGSVPWHRPSLPWVPASPVPHLRRYYDGATTSRPRVPGRLCVRFQGPHVPPIFVSAKALSGQRRTAAEPGPVVQPASRFRRAYTGTRAGYLRFPGDPSYTFALFADPGRTDPASPLSAASVLPPVPTLRRLQRDHDIGA